MLGLHVDLLADMGAYLQLVTPGVPILGAFMYNAIYKMDALPFDCTGVFTTKTPTDAYRGAGPPGGDVRHRADHGRARRRARHATRWSCAGRTGSSTRSSRTPTVAGLTYDSRQLRGRHRQGAWTCSATTSCAREQAERRERKRPGPARHRHLDLHRDVRPGAVAACWARCRTAPAAGSRRPSGCCRPARSRSSPAPPRTARATRPRGARSSPTRSACRSRTSRSSHGDTDVAPKGMDTYGSRSLAVGGIAVHLACGKVVEKARGSPRTCWRRPRATSSSPTARSGSRARPRRRKTIQEIALAVFAAHDLPDGMEPTLDCRGRARPGQLLVPARHPPVRGRGRHRDRAGHEIRSYVGVDDVGKVVNPLIVEGQVHGGLAQGIAPGAVRGGRLRRRTATCITGTFVDYLVPGAADLPDFVTDRTETPATSQPAGRQGRRRGRHDRLDPGRGQRGRRRAAAVSASTTCRCRARRERVWRAIQERGRCTA